jgi:acyl-coenzyme A synthetase/AMP-(fatty) acid ligase
MQKIYNIKEGDVFWAASDVGWVGPQLYRLWSFNQ